MAGSPSKSQIDRLGDRLRRSSSPSDGDLQELENVRRAYDPALESVGLVLKDLGYSPRSRLKTTGTILDKLRRRPTRLSTIQDIGGARVVGPWLPWEQDEVAARISAAFPDSRVDDLRTRPSEGYRAVHVIVKVDGFQIEIQVRTTLQDAWANAMEKLGDAFGREIRYSGSNAPGLTSEQALRVKGMLRISELIAKIEEADGVARRLAAFAEDETAPRSFRRGVTRMGASRDELHEMLLSLLAQVSRSDN